MTAVIEGDPEFVHLHVHSEYSLADSLLKVKQLVKQVQDQVVPAIAITDVGNLFALVKFYETCIAAGIKPILGAELRVVEEDLEASLAERGVVLAMNAKGYANLIQLVSASYTTVSCRGVVPEKLVFEHSKGLIVLSGGVRGHLWQLSQSSEGK